MRNDKFILDGHNPIPEPDVLKWGEWFQTITNRVVQKTKVTPKVEVSTVFLGLDHNFLGKGKPILFETMIFGGKRDQEQYRYCTWDEAEKGHAEIVASFKKKKKSK